MKTHTMRLLSMPDQTTQFFETDKRLESAIEQLCCLLDHWLRPLPSHILCLWKQFCHQFFLTAQHYLDNTITDPILRDRPKKD